MEIQAYDFAGGVDNSPRPLDGLRQAPSHPDVVHGEAWQAASIVHVRVPEELLSNTTVVISDGRRMPEAFRQLR